MVGRGPVHWPVCRVGGLRLVRDPECRYFPAGRHAIWAWLHGKFRGIIAVPDDDEEDE